MIKPIVAATLMAASFSVFAGGQPAWFDKAVDAEYDKMVEMRIKLHQMPELANQEVKTQQVIVDFLKKAGVDKVIKGYKGSPTAVIGILNPDKGDTIGLRADIDGLPIKENTGLPYASKAKGKMWGRDTFVAHMCGHDAHMTMLLTAAKILAQHKNEIKRRVVFVFQPAEEGDSLENPLTAKTPKVSGAKRLVADGLIEEFDIKHMFGIHVQTRAEPGVLEIASGSAMNSGDSFEINIEGKQAHGAMPWNSIDATLTTAQTVVALQQIVSRNINSSKGMGIITVGKMTAGETVNVISRQGYILGTVRANDSSIRETMLKRIPEVAEYTAKAAGAKATTRIIEAYPVTWNDPKLTAHTLKYFQSWDINAVPTTRNPGASEDFAYYAQKVPCVFMFLGVDSPDDKNAAINHSDKFKIYDPALKTGVKAHISAAMGDYSKY